MRIAGLVAAGLYGLQCSSYIYGW